MQKKPHDAVVDRSCDEVRRLIYTLIDGGEFTITGFCREIGVSMTSYYRFMKQSGPWKGEKGDTFPSALQYLQQRERDGVAIAPKSKISRPRGRHRPGFDAVADITLEGELNDKVPVYDTCDTIRRKITARMRRPEVTQTSLLRHLSAQFHTAPKKVRPSDLEKFRSASGTNIGNANPTFYAAYVLFEKERIRAKGKKGKLREVMEVIYGPSGGVNVTTPADDLGGWFGRQPQGAQAWIDKYGLAFVIDGTGIGLRYGPPGCPVKDPELRWYLDEFYVYD
jgi:hypothetical protein